MTAKAQPHYTAEEIRQAAVTVISEEQNNFATPFTDDELLEFVRSG